MSLANDSLLKALGEGGYAQQEMTCPNANSQGTATRITAQVARCTSNVGNGSAVLPPILSNEADSAYGWIINDGANTIKLFPATGENMNGVANASLSIAAGASAFYYKEPATTGKGGGQTGTTNWHANSVT